MIRPERPLAGRTVLVTRPAEQAGRLGAGLRELGARVEMRPAICQEPPGDPVPARRAVANLERYGWIVFTSANGVRFFRAMLREVCGEEVSWKASVAAIGPATARELARVGHAPDLVAEDQHSEGLARALEGRIKGGERVLLVRPEVARPVLADALRAQGARPEPVAFYRNAPAPDIASLAAEVRRGRFDVVVLTSPSNLQRLLEADEAAGEATRTALGRSRIVAIGPVTARAVVAAGLATDAVATAPTGEALAAAVGALFA